MSWRTQTPSVRFAYTAALFVICCSWVSISPPQASAQLAPQTLAPQTDSLVVTITSPDSGSTVAGTIPVRTSNAHFKKFAVVGVQIKLDGVNLGAEVTASPWTVSWDTTLVANGNHTLTAVARDAAGNTATSAAVIVAVNNPPR